MKSTHFIITIILTSSRHAFSQINGIITNIVLLTISYLSPHLAIRQTNFIFLYYFAIGEQLSDLGQIQSSPQATIDPTEKNKSD